LYILCKLIGKYYYLNPRRWPIDTAETLSAKQCILSAAENRYNRKFTSLRAGIATCHPPPIGSAATRWYLYPWIKLNSICHTHIISFLSLIPRYHYNILSKTFISFSVNYLPIIYNLKLIRLYDWNTTKFCLKHSSLGFSFSVRLVIYPPLETNRYTI